MSPRPGSTPRSQACCMVPFFAAFAAVPAFMLTMFFKKGGMEGWERLFLIIPVLFLAIGIWGVYHGVRVFLGAPAKAKPATLGAAKLPKKQDQRLPNGYYRLKPETSARTQFLFLLFFALFWNGLVWAFLVPAMLKGDGPPSWFGILFVGVGLLVLFLAGKSFLRWTLVGRTLLEISARAVEAGQQVEMSVCQDGSFTIDELKVALVCREQASYGSGTDRVTKTEMVQDITISEQSNLAARAGRAICQQSFRVPEDAIPTFEAPNNKIDWLVRVKMTLTGRPDVELLYRLVVLPPNYTELEPTRHG